MGDPMQKLGDNIEVGKRRDVSIYLDRSLRYKDRLCMSRETIIWSSSSKYSVHLGGINIYRDLRQYFYWPGMTKNMARYVSRCLSCQQITAKY